MLGTSPLGWLTHSIQYNFGTSCAFDKGVGEIFTIWVPRKELNAHDWSDIAHTNAKEIQSPKDKGLTPEQDAMA